MIVKYDLDVISESTRWQCHSFLSIALWNMTFLFKYLHAVVIFIPSVLTNFEVFETFPSFAKPHNYIPKKKQRLLCKDEELASYEASDLFLGVQCWGAYGVLCRMLNSNVIISCTKIRTSHPEICQSSKHTFIYSSKSKIKN